MKHVTAAASLAALLCSCSAPKVALQATYGELKPDGDLGYATTSGGVSGSTSTSDLAIDDSEAMPGARADLKWGAPHLTLSTQASSWDGRGTLAADFGGISASTAVDTSLDLALHRGVLPFDVLPTENVELGLGLGVTVADVEASVNDVGGNVTESADEVLPIPVLAVRGGARFGGLHVEALVSGMTINYDGDDATYLEADLQAGLDLFGAAGALSGGVVAGYRYIALDVEYDDATESADLDLTFNGPYLGLSLSF